ncbi:mitochondrial substrate carrier [Micractinium conductrix]|uniref:Mitochondrial substrate carrier n=1 Tax=Micractinium conductrix TaxID=554055 RepID=A0A2P6V996_9CHLO|nr:mitochondrial substrate carrier [Micractinium conductrix]|eukprot:PSC70667.1 mitochondrial substrate carrier [Micractinium conductrix]
MAGSPTELKATTAAAAAGASAAAAMAQQQQQHELSAAGLGKLWDSSRMFVAGGSAGAVARTATAPLDRIKLLFQVQAVPSAGTSSTAYTGVGQAARKILAEEGFRAFWKGNGLNIIRIFPYSAAQLSSNDQYKRIFADEHGELTVPKRLLSGACAGMTATALTHPLDTMRLRMAMPHHGYKGMADGFITVARTEGLLALYKGLIPTLVGIAPYAALNFASYDLLKRHVYDAGDRKQHPGANLLMGGAAGTVAATVCYPLDTIRRRMQMKGVMYSGQFNAFATIWRTEGVRGFYRGWAANSMKVVPQNAIRFVSYEALKTLMGIKKAKTDT